MHETWVEVDTLAKPARILSFPVSLPLFSAISPNPYEGWRPYCGARVTVSFFVLYFLLTKTGPFSFEGRATATGSSAYRLAATLFMIGALVEGTFSKGTHVLPCDGGIRS